MANNDSQQDLLFINPGVTTETNVHFNEHYCTECHLQRPNKGDAVQLRYENYTLACRCHGYTSDTYTHPVDIPLSAEKLATIPAEFPLTNNKITCTTCHNMALQCEPKFEFKRHNKAFLRTDPSLGRTFLCFQCHQEKQYKMLDPHKQLDASGAINSESCLYCHETKPDVESATLESRENGEDTVHLVGDLEVLCLRCHNNKAGNHPLSTNHRVKPSEKVSTRMHWSEKNLSIILPLNDEGKITCITCHNPHELGVIPTEKAASAGASDKGRLRKAWGGGSICVACHNM
ncbi:MAG: hypothetical protein KKB91_05785 [Proteobacteria bacterium]|nr:hypothetical protein [Desulfocapsa sp.]MBU3944185.1 hypothetical protein [Pseudomonadota bacterium]MCG2743594.1 hypothetical protein [Desulfobacteraceae bacterium]MBU3984791.1 hypothetical protein [Pseudomonadota bacterium]MBU4028786.1 hypothetical protein [Pseudomonadota bacterium]